MSNKYIHVHNSHYEFKYYDTKYNIDIIHPLIEQMRESIIKSIKLKFMTVTKKYILDKYIQGKHNADRVLETMFARFMFNLLAISEIDPVIPDNVYTIEPLKEDLRVKLRKVSNISDIEQVINNILTEIDFQTLFEQGLIKLEKYVKDTKLVEVHITIENNDDSYTLSYLEDKIIINKLLYDKILLKYKITNKPYMNDVNILIWCLIKRYMILQSFNQQLAVHPNILSKLKKQNIKFELFGSVFNTFNNKYCSMFYDIEKYFGSFGSFYKFIPIKGYYLMNPPFDELLIENAVSRVINFINQTEHKLSIMIWIPVWDKLGIQYIKQNCKKSFISNHDYGPYIGLTLLEESKLIKSKKIICMDKMQYFDYLKMKKTTAANTYNIIISN